MKTIIAQLAVFIMLITSCQGIAQEKKLNVLSYYPYIKAIFNGPIIWHKDTSNPYDLGVMHRAVIIIQETYYGLVIETYKVADEGRMELIKSEFANLEMNSDKLEFKSWVTPNTIKIEHGNTPYEITITDKGITKRRG